LVAALLAGIRVFLAVPPAFVASACSLPLVALAARAAGAGAAAFVARFAGAAPLAAFAAGRLAGDDLAGDVAAFAAPRFTGSAVAGLAFAATYTPSVGLTFGGFGHG
jgi:hypothetical protein